MKKIAIKGHLTRGEDVIKILESLGGINKLNLEGYKCTGYYYIENNCRINCTFLSCLQEYTCYTLEEYEQTFLKAMEKIAIQGHSTRSKDVIKTLESLGGKNRSGHEGWNESNGYYVDENNYICCNTPRNIPKDYKLYTLEEYEQQITRKQIAIQGHPTRNNDIIKILESLGGINGKKYLGYDTDFYYYINTRNYIDCDPDEHLPQGYKKYTLEEYEQIQKDMENKRTIQIDLNTAREWYKQGGDLRKVALQAFTESELNSLPKSWEEYCKINPRLDANKEIFLLTDGHINHLSATAYYARKEFPGALPSKERAEQFLILNKLLQIRDYYNQGWKPDWSNKDENKYIIGVDGNRLFTNTSSGMGFLFAFKTKELRDGFLTNFKKDLEFIKEFL